jgi:hypothetical protein
VNRNTTAALVAPPQGAAGDALERAADALGRVHAREEVADVLEPLARELDAVRVVVHERRGDALVPVSATGAGDDAPVVTPAMLAGGAVAIVRGAGPADPLAVADLRARGFGALLAVPVTRDGEIVGAVELDPALD